MVLTFLMFAALVRQSWSVCRPHVRLEDNLDETANLGFCPDLAGWGNSITFDDPLQVRYLHWLFAIVHAHCTCDLQSFMAIALAIVSTSFCCSSKTHA